MRMSIVSISPREALAFEQGMFSLLSYILHSEDAVVFRSGESNLLISFQIESSAPRRLIIVSACLPARGVQCEEFDRIASIEGVAAVEVAELYAATLTNHLLANGIIDTAPEVSHQGDLPMTIDLKRAKR